MRGRRDERVSCTVLSQLGRPEVPQSHGCRSSLQPLDDAEAEGLISVGVGLRPDGEKETQTGGSHGTGGHQGGKAHLAYSGTIAASLRSM